MSATPEGASTPSIWASGHTRKIAARTASSFAGVLDPTATFMVRYAARLFDVELRDLFKVQRLFRGQDRLHRQLRHVKEGLQVIHAL